MFFLSISSDCLTNSWYIVIQSKVRLTVNLYIFHLSATLYIYLTSICSFIVRLRQYRSFVYPLIDMSFVRLSTTPSYRSIALSTSHYIAISVYQSLYRPSLSTSHYIVPHCLPFNISSISLFISHYIAPLSAYHSLYRPFLGVPVIISPLYDVQTFIHDVTIRFVYFVTTSSSHRQSWTRVWRLC